METVNYIYHLISFSQDYIDNWTGYRECNEIAEKAVKGMSRSERNKWFADHPHKKFDLSTGKAYRGSWTDKADLLKTIETYPDSICESYYTYLLIERKQLGSLDDVTWPDDESETWFKLNYEEDDNIYEYREIERPDCFQGTCNFT